MDIKVSKLKSGASVITSQMPSMYSISAGIWAGVGSRYENKSLAGVSHFLEHLLFKGTARRSAKAISQDIEGCGGYLNAFTQEESTCYYARFPFEHFDGCMDVLTDMYLNAAFDPQELERERGVIIEEMMMYRDQPHHHVQEMLTELFWSDHPLGRPIIGNEKIIQGVSRDEIIDFKKKTYVPANTVFAFAGNVDHERCVSFVEKMTSGFKGGRKPLCRKVTAKNAQKRIGSLDKDIEQAHLALGFRLFGREDSRRYALKVLNTVLGENMSSRLFQVIREKHGLAYSVGSNANLFKDSGSLVVLAGLERSRHVKAVELIAKEFRRLKRARISGRELSRAKDYLTGQLRLGLESSSNRMIWIAENLIESGKVKSPDEVIKSIESVTSDDILALCRDVITPDRVSIALIARNLTDKELASCRLAMESV